MNTRETWRQFVNEDALPKRTETLRKLNEYFQSHMESIAERLVTYFDSFCQHVVQLQDQRKLGKCVSINFSLLRTRLLFEDRLEYMFEAFDLTSIKEVSVSTYSYHADWIQQFYREWYQFCDHERKKYMGRIEPLLLEAWMHEQLQPFHEYMTHAVRYAAERLATLSSFHSVLKEDSFEIRVGEYRDPNYSESVYRMNEIQRLSVSCKGWLENKIDQEYIYEHIRDVDISNGQYSEINLNYARLEKVDFSASQVKNSYLLGTRFESCNCCHTDFSGSAMLDADFRDCDLQRALFDQVFAIRDLMNEDRGIIFGIHGVRFQGANLTDASFRYAQIAGDFTGAILDGTDFTGANLAGSRMLKRDRDKILLSEEQRQSIYWIEG